MRSFPKKRIQKLRRSRKHKDIQQHEPEEKEGYKCEDVS